MRPLDESLRAAATAVTGRPGPRQGGRDQGDAAPGAFEEAVADAGRQKVQGHGSAQIANDAQPTSAALAKGRGATAASIAEGNTAPTPDAAPEDLALPSDGADVSRHRAAKALQQDHLAGTPSLSRGREGGNEAEPKMEVAGRSREAAQANADAADEAPAVPAAESGENTALSGGGTVTDLLSMLAGAVPPAAVAAQSEGKARPTSAGRDGSDGVAKAATGASADGADGEHIRAGEVAGDTEADQLFRFARADGKGQSVSMSISQDGERVTVENSRSSGASKAETVTVLEARRYLGLAISENTTSVNNAIAGDSGWTEALQSAAAAGKPEAWTQAGKTLNTLKIQMHPIDLGVVTATLRLKDDELQVELKVETGEAFRQLRDDQSEMVKALRAQGFAVDQVNIVFNSGGDAAGSGAQSQAQTQLGQQGGERAGENGSQGRQRQDGGEAAERWTGNEGADDASVGAERSRAGHVYM